MKRINLYWKKELQVSSIANTMTRDRFYRLRNHLSVTDEMSVTNEEKASDRFWKVRPLLKKIWDVCQRLPREEELSLDEQMISFTGRCPSRQYVPRKPANTGFKNFVLAGASGLVVDFEVYQGTSTFSSYCLEGKPVGQGSGAVLRMAESLSPGQHLYCDRFFVSIPIIEHLKKEGISLTGTINKDRVPKGVKVSSDKEMKAMGRGSSEMWVCGDVAVTKWFDNKPILVASSRHGVEPADSCKRWSKADKCHIDVNRPSVIREYNRSMGGVDLCDRMISYHRVTSRTVRWPLRMIMHFLDLSVVNGWVENKLDNPESKLQLFEFRMAIGWSLISQSDAASVSSDDEEVTQPPVLVRSVQPLPDARARKAKHMPECVQTKNPSRCRLPGCSQKTRVMCTTCNVYLCMRSGKNCYKEFHS